MAGLVGAGGEVQEGPGERGRGREERERERAKSVQNALAQKNANFPSESKQPGRSGRRKVRCAPRLVPSEGEKNRREAAPAQLSLLPPVASQPHPRSDSALYPERARSVSCTQGSLPGPGPSHQPESRGEGAGGRGGAACRRSALDRSPWDHRSPCLAPLPRARSRLLTTLPPGRRRPGRSGLRRHSLPRPGTPPRGRRAALAAGGRRAWEGTSQLPKGGSHLFGCRGTRRVAARAAGGGGSPETRAARPAAIGPEVPTATPPAGAVGVGPRLGPPPWGSSGRTGPLARAFLLSPLFGPPPAPLAQTPQAGPPARSQPRSRGATDAPALLLGPTRPGSPAGGAPPPRPSPAAGSPSAPTPGAGRGRGSARQVRARRGAGGAHAPSPGAPRTPSPASGPAGAPERGSPPLRPRLTRTAAIPSAAPPHAERNPGQGSVGALHRGRALGARSQGVRGAQPSPARRPGVPAPVLPAAAAALAAGRPPRTLPTRPREPPAAEHAQSAAPAAGLRAPRSAPPGVRGGRGAGRRAGSAVGSSPGARDGAPTCGGNAPSSPAPHRPPRTRWVLLRRPGEPERWLLPTDGKVQLARFCGQREASFPCAAPAPRTDPGTSGRPSPARPPPAPHPPGELRGKPGATASTAHAQEPGRRGRPERGFPRARGSEPEARVRDGRAGLRAAPAPELRAARASGPSGERRRPSPQRGGTRGGARRPRRHVTVPARAAIFAGAAASAPTREPAARAGRPLPPRRATPRRAAPRAGLGPGPASPPAPLLCPRRAWGAGGRAPGPGAALLAPAGRKRESGGSGASQAPSQR
ncbi:collagen alpha-1(I) chain-like [Sorex fumeus]|uniref:collagen alpha-1(I) chain-like n=1 Tax=Sorex fumeus TaxID=62283 RepID=UPI0024ACEC3E|nr:collagen alpha-1(I) chain-like [Sorex fumeus]